MGEAKADEDERQGWQSTTTGSQSERQSWQTTTTSHPPPTTTNLNLPEQRPDLLSSRASNKSLGSHHVSGLPPAPPPSRRSELPPVSPTSRFPKEQVLNRKSMENPNLNGISMAAGAFEDDKGGSGETRWERNVGLFVASQQTALAR